MAASPPVKQRLSIIPAEIPEEIEVGEIVVETDEDEARTKAGEDSESDSEDDHENRTFFKQLLHGSSMASALSMLTSRTCCQATREYENRVRMGCIQGLHAALQSAEYGEFGQPVTCKEAFKAFSHTFRGNGREGEGGEGAEESCQ